MSRDVYVIQADADTIALGDVSQAVYYWRNNQSFILGTDSGRTVMSAAEVAAMVKGWIREHDARWGGFGVKAESALDRLPGAASRKYVHASSGFGGYAKGAFRTLDLEKFSREMLELLGDELWNTWGSEQISSNYMLANAPDVAVLPFPAYACFEPHTKYGNHAFLHFIGTFRFDRGIYRRHARDAIAAYKRGNAGPDFAVVEESPAV
jgi:hypothetical protein